MSRAVPGEASRHTGQVEEFKAQVGGPGEVRKGSRRIPTRVGPQRISYGVVDIEVTNNQKGEAIIRKCQIWRKGPNTTALGPEIVIIQNAKLRNKSAKEVNSEQIKGNNIWPVQNPRKNSSIGHKTTRNIKGNLGLRVKRVGETKGLKTIKERKAGAPKRMILKTNNIKRVQRRSKEIKQGEKHIPATEAVVLNDGKRECRRKVLLWRR